MPDALRELSHETAKKKLEMIFQPNFYDFAVRAVSFAEFTEVMRRGAVENGREICLVNHQYFVPSDAGTLPNNARAQYEAQRLEKPEVYSPGDGGKRCSLSEYLDDASKDWDNLIWTQTLSPEYQKMMARHVELTGKLRSLAKATKDSLNGPGRREKILDVLHKEVLDPYKDVAKELIKLKQIDQHPEPTLRDSGFSDEQISRIKTIFQEAHDTRELKGFFSESLGTINPKMNWQQFNLISHLAEYRMILRHTGEDILTTLIDCVNDGARLFQPGNLKNVLYALDVLGDWESARKSHHRQYEVALILDIDVVGKANPRDSGTGAWGFVHHANNQEGLGGNILGAVALFNSPILIQRMVDISSRSGKAACPVITSKKQVKFPGK